VKRRTILVKEKEKFTKTVKFSDTYF